MIVPTKPPAAVHDQRDDQPDDDRRVDTMARDSGRIVPPAVLTSRVVERGSQDSNLGPAVLETAATTS